MVTRRDYIARIWRTPRPQEAQNPRKYAGFPDRLVLNGRLVPGKGFQDYYAGSLYRVSFRA